LCCCFHLVSKFPLIPLLKNLYYPSLCVSREKRRKRTLESFVSCHHFLCVVSSCQSMFFEKIFLTWDTLHHRHHQIIRLHCMKIVMQFLCMFHDVHDRKVLSCNLSIEGRSKDSWRNVVDPSFSSLPLEFINLERDVLFSCKRKRIFSKNLVGHSM
jgi:hypothetical protein